MGHLRGLVDVYLVRSPLRNARGRLSPSPFKRRAPGSRYSTPNLTPGRMSPGMSPGLPKVPPGVQWSFHAEAAVETLCFTEERSSEGRPVGVYVGGETGQLVRYHLSDFEKGGFGGVSVAACTYSCEHLVGKKINTIHAASGRVWVGADAGEIIEWDAATGAVRLRYQHFEDRTGWSTVRRRSIPAKVMCLYPKYCMMIL